MSERVILDMIRASVLMVVLIVVALLGWRGVLDAAAITGVLGATVGAVGTMSAATAVATRVMDDRAEQAAQRAEARREADASRPD